MATFLVDVEPGDREAAMAALWELRDLITEIDDCAAARLHSVYNHLVVGTGTDTPTR